MVCRVVLYRHLLGTRCLQVDTGARPNRSTASTIPLKPVGAATLSPLQCERRETHERRTLGGHRIDRGRSAGTDLSPFQLNQRVERGEDRIAGAFGTVQ